MAVSLELAISAIKAGRKEEGRQLLNLLIQQNPNNEMAWLWMSSVVTTDEQRARCLYHVLSIDPKNSLAQRGLQVLGIVVSDSRPVQVPRDSQPIHIPRPTAPTAQSASENGARRPFLIDPATMTRELPFVPVKPPFVQTVVHASPEILSLNVDEPDQPSQPVSSAENINPVATAALTPASPAPQPQTSEPTPKAKAGEDYVVVYPDTETQALSEAPVAEPASDVETKKPEAPSPPPAVASVQTQVMPTLTQPAPQPSAADTNLTDTGKLPQILGEPPVSPPAPQSNSQPVPPQPQQNGAGAIPLQQNGGFPPANPPLETRPSQPVYINYPDPNAGMPPYFAPQPQQQIDPSFQGQNPQFQPHALHSASTMSMPIPSGQYHRPPSEPVQVVQTHLGLVSFAGHYPYHSNATVIMPTMTEAEARARLGAGQAIPTASAAAMPLQTIGGWPTQHGLHFEPQPAYAEDEADDADGEMNVLALIIFGTLSITALGGLGMLVLLIFAAPGI